MKTSHQLFAEILFRVGFPAILFACLISRPAQGQGSATYPYVSPTAGASGMTSGLENGATAGTMNMMQVRAAARDSERAAAAAAMARSAESAIEEQALKTALEKARATRQAKIQASEQLKWKKATAYNAYNRVSSSEMSSWKDAEGNVRVGKGLPPEFVESVQRQQAARAAAEPEKKSPIKNIGQRMSEAVGVEQPVESGLTGPKPLLPANLEEEKKGRFSFNAPKLKMPKIKPPKIFSNNNDVPPPSAPQQQYASAPQQQAAPPQPQQMSSASATSAAPPAASAAPTEPVKIQQSRSAANMMNSQLQNLAENKPAIGNPLKKAGGLFSRNRDDSPPAPSTNRKLFGKKQTEPAPAVSSGLFPTESAPEQITLPSSAPQENRTIVSLPSSQPEAPRKKRFSLPRPKISMGSGSSGGGGTSPTTTVNQFGNSFYVVNSASQFMKYGAERTQTSITAVPPGTVVKMTKPGAEWATVELNDGSTGIIRVKNLRAAQPGN